MMDVRIADDTYRGAWTFKLAPVKAFWAIAVCILANIKFGFKINRLVVIYNLFNDILGCR